MKIRTGFVSNSSSSSFLLWSDSMFWERSNIKKFINKHFKFFMPEEKGKLFESIDTTINIESSHFSYRQHPNVVKTTVKEFIKDVNREIKHNQESIKQYEEYIENDKLYPSLVKEWLRHIKDTQKEIDEYNLFLERCKEISPDNHDIYCLEFSSDGGGRDGEISILMDSLRKYVSLDKENKSGWCKILNH